jgi:hypothetical protein
MLYLMCVSVIIDSKYHCYPVFNKILSACRQQYSRDEYDTVVETFEHFLRIMGEEGHIPEEHFDLGGIRMDKDINGKDVVRAATITQESYQRSKCLTHSRQVDTRLERQQIIKSKEIEKKETANLKHMELVEAIARLSGSFATSFSKTMLLGSMNVAKNM